MRFRHTFLTLAVLGGLTACGDKAQPSPSRTATATETPFASPGPPEGEAVSFRASDGVRLHGRAYGDGPAWVVFVHMQTRSSSEEDWLPLMLETADAGYRALAYNRRGVCARDFDCSEGENDLDASWRDVLGAVKYARREGAERVALVGASIGAMASLYAVAKERADVDALVAIAGINKSIEPYMFTPADLRRVGERSLYVSGDEDHHDADEDARDWAHWSGGELLIVKSRVHGTKMLGDSEATQGPLIDDIVGFLAREFPPEPSIP